MSLSSKVLIAASALMLGACSYNQNDYSCFGNVPSEGWTADKTFEFVPETADSIVEGSLSIFVRHTNNYPYSNLWVELESPERRDTFCIELSDVYGNWHGTGAGTSFQLRDTVMPRFKLLRGVPMRLRHIMRPENVTGLEQVGIIFEAD